MTTTDPTSTRTCGATGYGVVRQCGGAPSWDVIIRNDEGVETERHPACLTHSLAEMSVRLADRPMVDIDVIRVDTSGG